MSFDWDKWLEERRARDEKARENRMEKQDRRAAHSEHCEALTPQQLADQIQSTLGLTDFNDFQDIGDKLAKQSGVLDTIFYTKLHEAGLGFEHSLQDDPTQMALLAQKLCRQTFDSLKNLQDPKTCKGKEGPKK